MNNNNNFLTKWENYKIYCPTFMYFFEIIKSCGYSELVLVLKDDKLIDLYKMISLQLNLIMNLFELKIIKNETIIIIPNQNKKIREFIIENQFNLIPIYNFPDPVVYKIYLIEL